MTTFITPWDTTNEIYIGYRQGLTAATTTNTGGTIINADAQGYYNQGIGLGGALYGGMLQQQADYNRLAQLGLDKSWNPTMQYAQGLSKPTPPEPESNLAWLDRRVREMRVRL